MPTAAERLQEARNAYHLLMTGQSAVEIRDSNGESVRFTAANASRLLAYIDELSAEVAGEALQRTRRPLRPIWG